MLRCFLILLSAGLVACANISTSFDYDTQQSFTGFETYAWLPTKPDNKLETIHNSELVERRVEAAIDTAMQQRGLEAVSDKNKADLLVTYYLGQQQKIDVENFRSHFGYHLCMNCSGLGFGLGSEVIVNQYEENALTIDLIRAEDRRLVWRGVAQRAAKKFDHPQEHDQYIRETVAAIFKNFPPNSAQ